MRRSPKPSSPRSRRTESRPGHRPTHRAPGPPPRRGARARRAGHRPPGHRPPATGHRYHAIFTDSPLPLLDADICHRKHAIIEQVIADLKATALAHLPSGTFTTNAAWLALATISFNLTRAAGCAAGGRHTRASTPTLRRRVITVPARIASSARRLILHLPRHWPWQNAWQTLFTSSTAPPVRR